MKSLAPYVNDDTIPITSVMLASLPDASYWSVAKRPNGSVTLVIFSGWAGSSYESVVTCPIASVTATRRRLAS